VSAVIERSNLGRFLARPATAKSVALDAALVAGLTLLAVLIRLGAQHGILLYPDSYQFLLVIRGLAEGLPLDAAMGVGGDAWSAPFYRLGYPVLAFPLYPVLGDAEAAGRALSFAAGIATIPMVYLLARLAIGSRAAAIGAGLLLSVSFSLATWSKFVMPESTAVFLLTLSMLLAFLAGRGGARTLGAAAALASAVLILVRFEMILVVPSLLAFIALGARQGRGNLLPIARVYLASLAGLVVAFALGLWWAFGDVVSALSLDPVGFLHAHFVESTTDAHQEALALSGLRDFLDRDPLLVLTGGVGLALVLRWRREHRWALWLQVLPLFLLYVLRNDMRYFSLLAPALAYAGGLAFAEAWGALSRLATSQRTAPALAVSTAASLGLVALVSWQMDLTNDTWHPSQNYEYAAATEVDKRLADLDLSERPTLCAYYAEVYYYVTELPTRRANVDALAACLDNDGHAEPVLLIVDAPLRMLARDGVAGLEEAARPVAVLGVNPSAPFLHGRYSYVDTELIRGYLLR
jgi:hypothetical protein